MGFEPTYADPDVWIRPAVREDGFEYYEMILVYVDDALAISEAPRKVIENLGSTYKIKEGSDKEPDIYLGANFDKIQTASGNEIWAMSPRDYVNNAIKTTTSWQGRYSYEFQRFTHQDHHRTASLGSMLRFILVDYVGLLGVKDDSKIRKFGFEDCYLFREYPRGQRGRRET